MVKTTIVQSSMWKSLGFSIGAQITSVQGVSGPGTQAGFAQLVGVTLRKSVKDGVFGW